jgi:hypothetical protein
MTGSTLLFIILPIVALGALGAWLGMVFWADAHPGRTARAAAPGAGVTAGDALPAGAEPGAARGSELPLPRGAKAA